jgi:hypothetical protein
MGILGKSRIPRVSLGIRSHKALRSLRRPVIRSVARARAGGNPGLKGWRYR